LADRVAIIRFNPRPRTEGDRGASVMRRGSESFNPRPRTEGDVIDA